MQNTIRRAMGTSGIRKPTFRRRGNFWDISRRLVWRKALRALSNGIAGPRRKRRQSRRSDLGLVTGEETRRGLVHRDHEKRPASEGGPYREPHASQVLVGGPAIIHLRFTQHVFRVA